MKVLCLFFVSLLLASTVTANPYPEAQIRDLNSQSHIIRQQMRFNIDGKSYNFMFQAVSTHGKELEILKSQLYSIYSIPRYENVSPLFRKIFGPVLDGKELIK